MWTSMTKGESVGELQERYGYGPEGEDVSVTVRALRVGWEGFSDRNNSVDDGEQKPSAASTPSCLTSWRRKAGGTRCGERSSGRHSCR